MDRDPSLPQSGPTVNSSYAIVKERSKVMLDVAGIIKPYGLEQHHGSLVLVLEDVGGESLKNVIAAQKVDLTSFLQVAIQLADTLGQLHQHYIIHKDIKPANIINPETWQVKVAGVRGIEVYRLEGG